MEFSLKKYKAFLVSTLQSNYSFVPFNEHFNFTYSKYIVLRHDVDLIPINSLRFAKIQAEFNIRGTYYFRAVPESWDEDVILQIADMGHEVGYHYETMDTSYHKIKGKRQKLRHSRNPDRVKRASGAKDYPPSPRLRWKKKAKGTQPPHKATAGKKDFERGSKEYDKLLDRAYEEFCENLEKLRKLVPVKTICMHGSPRSPFDNKAIWEKYDYRDLGIIGEPYFDVNFDDIFYLTDTGRRWDGWKVSVRDKVPQQQKWIEQGLAYHSTQDIIRAIRAGNFPQKVMFTFHPQRWHDRPLPWMRELLMQRAKNVVKGFIVRS